MLTNIMVALIKILRISVLISFVLFFLGKYLLAGSVLEEVSQTFKKNFIANFINSTTDYYNPTPIVASGRVYFKKGGQLRFEYITPDPQLIIIGKEKVWIYDETLNNVTISNIDKIQAIDTLIFFQNPDNISQYFSIIINPQHKLLTAMADQKLLYLKNYDTNNSFGEIHLAYNTETKLIEQLGIIDQQNNTRIFKFSEFEFPLGILDTKFEFIVPENVEIIEE